MARVKDQPQTGFDDKFIEDPDLEEQIEKYLDTKEAARDNAKAKAAINARLALLPDLQDGQLVRVGRYTLPMKARAGGGFEIPTWEKVVVGKISEQ